MKRIKNILISSFLSLLIIHFSLFITPTFAQEATQSATQSATIQDKLKALQEAIASKASLLKPEISKKLQNKAYVGTLKTKSTDFLELEFLNVIKKINFNEFTQITGTKVKTINDLKEADPLAALGDIDQEGNLTAKKIVKLSSPPLMHKEVLFGEVTSIDSKTITLKLSDQNTKTLTFDSKTTFKLSSDNLPTNKAKVGNKVMVIGVSLNDINNLYARTIFLN